MIFIPFLVCFAAIRSDKQKGKKRVKSCLPAVFLEGQKDYRMSLNYFDKV